MHTIPYNLPEKLYFMSQFTWKNLIIIAGLLGAWTAAQAQTCSQFSPDGVLPTLDNPKLTPRTTLLCNDGYASLNSGLVHAPLW